MIMYGPTSTFNVCELYHKDNVVCPPKLKKGLFTTAAVDNIDHNPTSTSAKTAFHGTVITLMQHKFPEETGVARDFATQSDNVTPTLNMKVKQLPSDYEIVPPCFVDIKKSTCPQSEIYTHDVSTTTPLVIEKDWLESTMTNDFKPWAAHHAATDKDIQERHSTDIAILPLFREYAHTPAMMLHSMNIVTKATKFINPDQIPVIVADQPLYTLLKQLQYLFPLKVGEDKILIMMGGLHIEMAALRLIGQWLSGSGWVEALVQANVTTQGRSESMLTASHVTRTRYAHQVTAAALYYLQKEAYQAQLDVGDEAQGPLITFGEWRLEKCASTPQFKYWDLVLNLELMILQWLSVHLRDLVNLEKMHPDLLKHFEKGQFVARKTDRPFSGIALDQAHEQINAILKGDGGMIGITENADSFS
ncbi:uncharacterized protein LOC134752421 [Cydia strobilella]|uniref:uncharacterized protein LOC134752421 n=1 Tax=Cydia strobilella TaxID=1100964 RepID=UPI003007C81B